MTLPEFFAGSSRILRRSLRKRGILRTVPFLAYRVTLLMFGYHRPPGPSQFDRLHGTDTSGEVALDTLEIQSTNVRFGRPYSATPAELLREMFGVVEQDWRGFLFIDFGSGKGLPMMLASEQPFRRIIGVEFAPELIRVARQNLRRYRTATQKCSDFELICGDAAEYAIPPEPALLYFAYPFTGEVMRRVVDGIENSLREAPRELWIFYLNPVDHRSFDRPTFTPVVHHSDFAIYRCSCAGRPSSGTELQTGLAAH